MSSLSEIGLIIHLDSDFRHVHFFIVSFPQVFRVLRTSSLTTLSLHFLSTSLPFFLPPGAFKTTFKAGIANELFAF